MNNADGLRWRKASYSDNGGNCVEVGQTADGTILVRDTKDNGHGPVHRYTTAEWRAFTTATRANTPNERHAR
jgi:hypothetical protein